MDYDDLVSEARAIEGEVQPVKTKLKSNDLIDSTQDKLNLVLTKLSSLEADVEKLKHMPWSGRPR